MTKRYHVYENYTTEELMDVLISAIEEYTETERFLKINIIIDEIKDRLNNKQG